MGPFQTGILSLRWVSPRNTLLYSRAVALPPEVDGQVWTTLIAVGVCALWCAVITARSATQSLSDAINFATVSHGAALALVSTPAALLAFFSLSWSLGPHAWVPIVAAAIGFGIIVALLHWHPGGHPNVLSRQVAALASMAMSAALQRQAKRVMRLAKHYETLSTAVLTASVWSYPELRAATKRLEPQAAPIRRTSLALMLAKKRVGIDCPARPRRQWLRFVYVAAIIVLLWFLSTIAASSWHLRQTYSSRQMRSSYVEAVEANYLSMPPHHRKLVVVFVHGIFGDQSETWTNGSTTFPLLLATDPNFRDRLDVYVCEYFTPLFGAGPSIVGLADQLRGDLNDHEVFEDHQRVVFVGHSMGGIVVRQFLLTNRDRFSKVAMLYFYATPTNGAELAEVASKISLNPQLRSLFPLERNDFLQSVASGWLAWTETRRIPSYCAYETLPTLGTLVVSIGSATALCNQESDALSATHIDIVKPRDRGDPRYTRFATALRTVLAAATDSTDSSR